mgnify:CR=1 FL=1
MPGRGQSDEYVNKAAKQAKEAIDKHFHHSSDEVQAAVIAGVFSIYAENTIPSYIFETSEY